MALWNQSGLAGTVMAITGSVISPSSVLLEYEALSALYFPSFCAKILSTSKLPACDKARSGLQNLSTHMLVIVRFLFLSFPNVLLSLCATS